MFGIEYRRGMSMGPKETSLEASLDEALARARRSPHCGLADNIRITSALGKEIGVFPVRGASSNSPGCYPYARQQS
jgi:hypothetical protein